MESAALPPVFATQPRYETEHWPPAPRLSRLTQSLRVSRDPLGFMLGLREELGPVFTVRMFPFDGIVMATDPATNQEVLTDQERFVGGDAAGLLVPIVGAGSLICTPPPRHLRNRKLLLPSFHGRQIQQWGERMRELVVSAIDELPRDRPVAIRPVAQRLTLDVILRLVFGVTDAERVREFRRALDRMTGRGMQYVLFVPALQRELGPLSPGGQFVRRRAVVDALIRDEIARRRAAGGEGDDVLSLLLHARDEEGRGFTDDELLDELKGLLVAGHETTATALAWTLHLLAHNPSARDALIERPEDDELLTATIKESMRMRAPVFDAIRIATRDTTLGGQPVPAGAFVSAMFCVTHLAPELWDAPHEFRPERHLDGKPAPYALTPFGGGVRRCLGAPLAQLELEVAVREVLARVVPEPAGPLEAARLHAVTIIPSRGGRVVLRPR
jgi:cytochrome P450